MSTCPIVMLPLTPQHSYMKTRSFKQEDELNLYLLGWQREEWLMSDMGEKVSSEREKERENNSETSLY